MPFKTSKYLNPVFDLLSFHKSYTFKVKNKITLILHQHSSPGLKWSACAGPKLSIMECYGSSLNVTMHGNWFDLLISAITTSHTRESRIKWLTTYPHTLAEGHSTCAGHLRDTQFSLPPGDDNPCCSRMTPSRQCQTWSPCARRSEAFRGSDRVLDHTLEGDQQPQINKTHF